MEGSVRGDFKGQCFQRNSIIRAAESMMPQKKKMKIYSEHH